MEVTVLELHIDGSEIRSMGPFTRKSSDEPTETDIEVRDETSDHDGIEVSEERADGEPETESGGRSWKSTLMGLLFLVALAVVAKRRMGGDDADSESVPELDESTSSDYKSSTSSTT